MNRKNMWIAGAALAVALVGGGAGIAAATGVSDDNEVPISGDALAKATAAALGHTGGGRVTETEIGDEDGYYEVEVTLDDGRQVDVHLDHAFYVLNSTADHASPNGQDDPNRN